MKVEIYTKDSCSYCIRAKNFFKSKGWEFTEHYITDETREVLIEQLADRLGTVPRTVPQIFINDQAIGGYNELMTWARNQ